MQPSPHRKDLRQYNSLDGMIHSTYFPCIHDYPNQYIDQQVPLPRNRETNQRKLLKRLNI